MPAKPRKDTRRVIPALSISLLLHLLGVWLVHVQIPPEAEQHLFRVRVPSYLPRLPQRYKPRPAVPVSRQLLERLQAESARPAMEIELGEGVKSALPEIEIPSLEDGASELISAGKENWQAVEDTLPDASAFLLEPVTELPFAPNPVLLDAERRQRSIIIIDPEDPRALQVHLHLPATKGMGKQALDLALHLRRALMLGSNPADNAVDLNIQLHMFPRGYQLKPEEMRSFPMIWTRVLSPVPPLDQLASYLEEGGFLLTSSAHQIDRLEETLRNRFRDRLERLFLDKDHPLFRCFYTIEDYHFVPPTAAPGSPCKRSIMPVDALQLDGRVVVISSYMTYAPFKSIHPSSRRIRYVSMAPCAANRFAVNVFLYGLIQPGKIGYRYTARK